jgi:hypothetical protein
LRPVYHGLNPLQFPAGYLRRIFIQKVETVQSQEHPGGFSIPVDSGYLGTYVPKFAVWERHRKQGVRDMTAQPIQQKEILRLCMGQQYTRRFMQYKGEVRFPGSGRKFPGEAIDELAKASM